MADITTQTIRDTFLDNLPENVTREEGEEFWNAWLDRQREGHEPDMPTPPVGFQYAPGEVDEFDYGEPDLEDEQLTEDQKRDMLGLVHDYAMNTSELETAPCWMPPAATEENRLFSIKISYINPEAGELFEENL